MDEMTSLLQDGVIVMFIGMGFVFIFLIIMVWTMNITARVIEKLNNIFPEATPETTTTNRKNQNDNNSEIIAVAIAAAKLAADGKKS